MTKSKWNLRQSYSDLSSDFFSFVQPTPVPSPQLVVYNTALAERLGLPLYSPDTPDGAAFLSGSVLPDGAQPLAQAYAGHQFGHFTMLGDGRAILLGEQMTPQGECFDIQFKGAGRTPYSRRGDGRAALGPMLREYLVSEAMAALQIPTTRSLAVTVTGAPVMREGLLPGAVLTRVASSHIRVGTFEYAAALGDPVRIAELTLYTLGKHVPDFPEDVPPALTLLQHTIHAQAALVARWMHIGFVHGVMNTDNMALSGETIDYGPCAFMDTYHPQTVFSSIDTQGRYSYAEQPKIALWNLERFAETLLPILAEDKQEAIELAQDALDLFADLYNQQWLAGMAQKLGFKAPCTEAQPLIIELLQLMQKHQLDYTVTFSSLAGGFSDESAAGTYLKTHADAFSQWLKNWRHALAQRGQSPAAAQTLMNQTNPYVIARNHRVHAALQAAEVHGDFAPFFDLLDVLRTPFARSDRHADYAQPPQPHERITATFCGT